MKPILLAAAALPLALTLGLSGCSAARSGHPADDGGSATVASAAGPDIPSGFTDLGNGLAVKNDRGHAEGCDLDLGSCYVFAVYAYRTCDVYAELNGLSGGTIVDYTNATASMSPGDTARLTFQFTTVVDSIKPTAINCN